MNNWPSPALSSKKEKSQMYVNAYKIWKIILKRPFVNNVRMSKQFHSKAISKLVSNILYFAKLSFKIYVILLWRQIKIKGSTDEQPFKSVGELVHLDIVITKRGVYFSHVWGRGGLALDLS